MWRFLSCPLSHTHIRREAFTMATVSGRSIHHVPDRTKGTRLCFSAKIQLEAALPTLSQLVFINLCLGLQTLGLCSRNALPAFYPLTFIWLTHLSRFRPSLPGTFPLASLPSPMCVPMILSSFLCPCAYNFES